jgi:hypothetical protein
MPTSFSDNKIFINGGEQIGSISRYASIKKMVSFDGKLVVAFEDGKVISYDSSWTNFNESGLASDGYHIGPQELIDMVEFNSQLLLIGRYGHIASYDSTTGWKSFSGEGAGTGFHYDGDINFSIITSVTVHSGSLVFGNWKGEVYSYDGTAWKWADGTGTGSGPYNDGSAIGYNDVSAMYSDGSQLIIASEKGAVASFDGAWKNFDGTGTGSGPHNDGSAVGGKINTINKLSGTLVFAGVEGRIASFNSTWSAYDSGTGMSDSGSTCMGKEIISSVVFDSKLVVGTANGFISYYDTQWRSPLSGGLASTGPEVDNKPVKTMVVHGTDFVVAGSIAPNQKNNKISRYNGSWITATDFSSIECEVSIGLIESNVVGSVEFDNKIITFTDKFEISYFDLATKEYVAYNDASNPYTNLNSQLKTIDSAPIAIGSELIIPCNGGFTTVYNKTTDTWYYPNQKDSTGAYHSHEFALTDAQPGGAVTALASDGSNMFFGRADGKVVASSASNKFLEFGNLRGQKITTMAVFNGHLYAANQLGDLREFEYDSLDLQLPTGEKALRGTLGARIPTYLYATDNRLIVGCDSGYVTAYDGEEFEHFKGVPYYYNDGEAVNYNDINCMFEFTTSSPSAPNVLVVAGTNGYVGSFDTSYWENWDGSGKGIGPYSDGGWYGMGTHNDGASFAYKNVRSMIQNGDYLYIITQNEAIATFDYGQRQWTDFKGDVKYLNSFSEFDSDAGGTADALKAENFYVSFVEFRALTDAQKQERIAKDLAFLTDDTIKGDNPSLSAVKRDLVFYTKETPWGEHGAKFSWTSSDYISKDGKVIRPTISDGPQSASLTATASFLKFSDTKNFSITVLPPSTDEEIVEDDVRLLTLPSLTKETVVMPTFGANGSVISWDTSHHNFVNSDGTVIRPPYTKTNGVGILVATISYGSVVKEKQIQVDVRKFDSAAEAIAYDISQLSIPSTINFKYNFPDQGYNDSVISWSFYNHPAIEDDGTVVRPAIGETNVTADVDAIFRLGDTYVYQAYSVTVEAHTAGSAAVTAAAEALEIEYDNNYEEEDSIMYDVLLPTAGINGTTISWVSNHPNITSTGVVTRPAAGMADVVGDLVATITDGTNSIDRYFSLNVLADFTDQEAVEFDTDWASVGEVASSRISVSEFGPAGSELDLHFDQHPALDANGDLIIPTEAKCSW